MSDFTIRTYAGDSTSSIDSGVTTISNAGNNVLRINSQEVDHNAGIVATTAPGVATWDVAIVSETIVYTKVLAMAFKCNLLNLNSNTLTPQVYLKLVGAMTGPHDYVIPLIPGQIFVWTPVPTKDANGATFTLESLAAVLNHQAFGANFTITCCPDKYSDVTISGTIELST